MKKLILLSSLVIAAFTAKSQVANADISVQVTSPTNNFVLPPDDTLYLSFNYTNNGPDVLPAGDSLYFYTTGNIVLYSQLLVDLPVGSSILMNDVVYFWNNTTDTIDGDICVLHIPQASVTLPGNGIPTTTYVDNNPANDTSCIAVVLEPKPVSLNRLTVGKMQFDIFPNPAKDKIAISPIFENQKTDVIITNSLGQTVWNESIQFNQKENYEINISNLPAGMYFVRQNVNGIGATANFTKK